MSSGRPSADPPFASVAVLGLGVMGGSVARTLRRLHPQVGVKGWSPDAGERRLALEARAVDHAPAALEEAVGGTELVVLALPLVSTCQILLSLDERTGKETRITDVASLKAPVADAAARAGLTERWVGAHPMCGSEGSGFDASRDDLYQDAPVWIVAHPHADPSPVEAFWASLGGRPARIDAARHDSLMARVSHLPQLVSTALAVVLAEAGEAPGDMGPGGRDVTRLAASNSYMWRDLFTFADPALAEGLRRLAHHADRLAEMLEAEDLAGIQAVMEEAAEWRRGG